MRRLRLFLILILVSPSLAISSQHCSDAAVVQLVTKAKKELNDRLYLTLASADFWGSPWNTPVYTGFDEFYNFFWISEKTSRHSRNIRHNSRAFVVIYNSTAPEGTAFGVYMQGHAYETPNPLELSYGLKLIALRAGVPTPPASQYQGSYPQRIYRFTPQKIWVNTVILLDGKLVDRRIDLTECMLAHVQET